MLGSLISAGIGLLGNLFNKSSQENYNNQQMQIAQQNMAMQREFAQSGVQWKVQDAIKAGIHPLAALGAQTSSFSPVSVGGEAPKMDFGNMGQDVSRALKAAMSQPDREEVDAAQGRKLALEKGRLENDILRAELNSKLIRQSRAVGQIGPPMPANSDLPMGSIMAHLSRSPERQSGFAVADDEMKAKEASGPGVKRLPLWGLMDLKPYPNRASAQDLENEWGEFGGSVAGLGNIPVDVWNTYGPSWDKVRSYLPSISWKPRRRSRPWGD